MKRKVNVLFSQKGRAAAPLERQPCLLLVCRLMSLMTFFFRADKIERVITWLLWITAGGLTSSGAASAAGTPAGAGSGAYFGVVRYEITEAKGGLVDWRISGARTIRIAFKTDLKLTKNSTPDILSAKVSRAGQN